MKLFKSAFGAIAGDAVGCAAGVLLAPRSGAESRAMASDAMNDAWDSAVDTYERGQQVVADKFAGVKPNVDATTDELRAKVDLARERMDQLRDSLNTAGEEAEAPAETVEIEAEVEEIVIEAEEPATEEPAAEDEAEAEEAEEE